MRISLAVLIVLSHISVNLFAQPSVVFDQLSTGDGLSFHDVQEVIKDSKGYMWFATDHGLNRYDGYEFKHFKQQANDSLSLGYNGLRSLMEDHIGNIWVGHLGGVSRLDPTTNKFKNFRHEPDSLNSLSNDYVQKLFESSDHKIWMGTAYGGISILEPSSDKFTHLRHDPLNQNSLISDNWIFDIHQDKDGIMWIATQEGLDEYNPSTGDFKHHLTTQNFDPPWLNPFTKSSVYSIYEDTLNNALWVGKRGAVVRYSKKDSRYSYFLLKDNVDAFSICSDGIGGLYVSGYQGLYHLKEIMLRSDGQDFSNLQPIKGGQLRKTYADNAGMIWVASLANGVYIIDDNKRGIDVVNNKKYFEVIDGYSELISDLTEDLLGNLYVATMGHGLVISHPSTGRFKNYKQHSATSQSLSHNYLLDLFRDQFGIIWIGTVGGGLDMFDPNTEYFKNFNAEKSGKGILYSNSVSAIYEDRDSNFWIGYFSPGLTRITMNNMSGANREPVSSKHFLPEQANTNLGLTFEFEEDKFGNIWVAKMNGLFKFDKTHDRFIKQPLSTLGKERVISIHEDASGVLWVGSDLGLFRAEPVPGFSESDSLKFVQVFVDQFKDVAEIIEDKNEDLWIVTITGRVYKVNSSSGLVKEFDFSFDDGGKRSTTWSSYMNKNGHLFLPRSFGFMKFHPDSIKTNPFIPPVVFTDFRLSGKSININDSIDRRPVLNAVIDHVEKITLPYGQNFTFEFAALNYTHPEKNQYSYKLEGFHENWSPPSTIRTADFTNIWEGDYTLRVRGSNNDGVWNENGASIRIRILPPWYRGKIALVIYGGLLVFALVWARKIIVEREREKAKRQLEHLELKKAQEMDQMKTQFFTNISHEFRTPLTLILGPLKQMYEGTFTGDAHAVIGVMIRNSKRLLHLINQLLDFSKLESGKAKLQASVGDLVEFVRTMFAAFESTAQSRKIRYVFQSDVSTLPTYYDRDKLEKVITNLLSNAFKFTDNGGSIEIHMIRNIEHSDVDKGEGVIEICIRDNGKGIPEDKLPNIFDRFYQVDETSTRQQEGTGVGLALAKELVELHHGNIKATSQKGDGTNFIIHLPIGRAHLDDSEVVVRKGYQEIDTSALETLPILANTTNEPLNGDGSLPLVLIIDDNEDMRLYLREVLGGQYRLVEASNGEKGWDSAHENSPDLVLSDVMMPEMDGHELCQKLKTDEHTSHIPVILLTARAGEKAKLEGLETGADDYITKPFSAEELRARIHNLIEVRQRLREQFSSSFSLEPKDLAITSADERFLQRAMDIMEIHRSDASFSTEAFIKEIGMSRAQLHRKLKALTDQSAGEFIRSYRLKYARQLIQKEYGNMAQVAYECGFNNPSYFAECFKKQFGILPSEFSKKRN